MNEHEWTKSGWRSFAAAQQPAWPDEGACEEILRNPLTLPQAVDRLTGAPARVQNAVGVVEHDDCLAALLDENSPPDRVGIRHVTAF